MSFVATPAGARITLIALPDKVKNSQYLHRLFQVMLWSSRVLLLGKFPGCRWPLNPKPPTPARLIIHIRKSALKPQLQTLNLEPTPKF